jgi:hypothetical protein
MPLHISNCKAINSTSVACCVITQLSLQLSATWSVPVFQPAVFILSLLSVIFLLAKVKKTLQYRIPLYHAYIIIACISFIGIASLSLIPEPSSDQTALFNLWIVQHFNPSIQFFTFPSFFNNNSSNRTQRHS